MGKRRTDDGTAKTRRECMGVNQGAGVNRDAGMDNMVHVNKGRSKSTRGEGAAETRGEVQPWQARQGHTRHAARMGMDDGVTGCTVRGLTSSLMSFHSLLLSSASAARECRCVQEMRSCSMLWGQRLHALAVSLSSSVGGGGGPPGRTSSDGADVRTRTDDVGRGLVGCGCDSDVTMTRTGATWMDGTGDTRMGQGFEIHGRER